MHWHPACILTLGVWVSVRLTLAEPCRLARKGAADTRRAQIWMSGGFEMWRGERSLENPGMVECGY
jgi:hypothetical protein